MTARAPSLVYTVVAMTEGQTAQNGTANTAAKAGGGASPAEDLAAMRQELAEMQKRIEALDSRKS